MAEDQAAFAAGREAAARDLAAGKLVYRWTGHAGPWGHDLLALMRERFEMSVDDGFGVCFTNPSKSSFNEGYNAIATAEVDRRHGAGAFDAAFHEAKRIAKARYDEYFSRNPAPPALWRGSADGEILVD